MTVRIALGVEYNGSDYHGWQTQPTVQTVQGELQRALSVIANEPIYLQCAGRTDAGVHATGQVVHFDTKARRHIDAWVLGTNAHLAKSVIVKWANRVDYHFHARFKASSRRYRYIIYNNPVRPGLLHDRVAWYYYPLDANRMQQAATYLLGENDFSSFRASSCQSNTPMRNVTDVTVKRHGDLVVIEIEANAFLHHMVRNVAAVLMKVGCGQKDPEWVGEVMAARKRSAAAETAPAGGLYLIKVGYPEPYDFPQHEQQFLL